MAVAALKRKPELKIFNASMHVTRVEEWCVEAETVEEARELLAAGAGYRYQIGECINIEVDSVIDAIKVAKDSGKTYPRRITSLMLRR